MHKADCSPKLLGDPQYRQGYLQNPPNVHLKVEKRRGQRNNIDYRQDEYRGYESWQYQVTESRANGSVQFNFISSIIQGDSWGAG